MQKVTKKKIISIAVICAVAFIFFYIIKSCNRGSEDKFEYTEATIGTVEKTIAVTGTLEVSGLVNILSKTNGIVQKVHAGMNDEVKKGQLLAEFNPEDINQRLSKMAAQLESMKLEMIIAKEDLESKRGMLKDNLISPKGLERAEMQYRSTQLKYRQVIVDYNMLRAQKDYTRITSPINGIVMKVQVAKDSPVGINNTLFTVAPSMKKMVLDITVDESEIGLVRKKQNVSFTVSAYHNKTFGGTINEVWNTPTVQGGLVSYKANILCDNNDLLLKPGMTATATIQINKLDKVLRVPNQSLQVNPVEGRSESDKNCVWRKISKMSGKLPVERVEVEIGLRGDSYTEIKKNLKKGDMVLVKYVKAGKRSR